MIKSAIGILTGSSISVVIGLISLPILTRVFEPDAFGVLQLFQSIVLYCIVYSSLRYEVAILTAPNYEVNHLLQLCFILTFITFILTTIACFTFIHTKSEEIGPLYSVATWIPFGLFIASISQILNYLAQRKKNHYIIAKAKILQSSVIALSGTGLGLLGYGSTALLASDLLGRFIFSIQLINVKLISHINPIKLKYKRLLYLIKKYRSLPFYSIPGGMINIAGGTLTAVMMFTVFDSTTAGQFSLAEKATLLPLGLIAAAVSQAFASEFSELLRTEALGSRRFYWNVISRMGLFGLIPSTTIFFFSTEIFLLIFGETWEMAANMAQLLSILMLVNFMVTPVNMAIMIIGNQRTQLYWEISRLIIMMTAWILIYYLSFNPMMALTIHVFCATLTGIIYLLLADRELSIYIAKRRIIYDHHC